MPPQRGPQVAVGSIFPFTKPRFFRYPGIFDPPPIDVLTLWDTSIHQGSQRGHSGAVGGEEDFGFHSILWPREFLKHQRGKDGSFYKAFVPGEDFSLAYTCLDLVTSERLWTEAF